MAGVCVLMVASGAAWESTALGLLTAQSGIVVLKRCVDVNDLLASAATGQADVAVLALDAHGFDATAVEHLARHQVRPVAVAPEPLAERARAARIGVTTVVAEAGLELLVDAVLDADDRATQLPEAPGLDAEPSSADPDDEELPSLPGRVVAVWGPAGSPGRTTVALALGAELARRRVRTLVVDADPYGGAVAQQLGVMDEVSGLLSAARLAASGELESRFGTVQRSVADRLAVVTGLPRADRWMEVRPGCLEHVLELGREAGHVVVDTGFCLEDLPTADFGSLPGRNSLTLAALAAADEVVVVGSADPVGLSRLARALVEIRDVTAGRPVRVVVNRMRPSLGWSERDIAGMVEGFSRVLGLHFLPEDRAAVDRALIAGHTLVESGDSALLRATRELAAAVLPELPPTSGRGRGRLRRRTAGRSPRS